MIFSYINSVAQQYNFREYSVAEGLPRSSTYALTQDDKGYLWIALEGGGVSRFDGYTFKHYDRQAGLPSQYVRAVFQDSKGNMWFGTYEGLCKLSEDGSLKVFTTEDGLIHNYVRTIAEDKDGKLWIGTNGGASIYDGQSFTHLVPGEDLLHKKVRIILRDSKNRMLVGTDGGITVFDGEKRDEWTLLNLLPDNTVLEIHEDSDDNIWIGTKMGAVMLGMSDTIYLDESDGLITNRIRAIEEDKFGHIWFGTREGVSEWDGSRFVNYTERNGISHNRIRDILRDRQGNLWFATYFGGLSRLSGDDFVAFTVEEGLLNNQVFSISEDRKGGIIMGTFDGVTTLILDDMRIDSSHNITLEDGLSGDRIYTVHKDEKGYFWYGTNFGISICRNDTVWSLSVLEGIPGEDVFSIIEDAEGSYWIGTSDGFCHLDFNAPSDFKLEKFDAIQEQIESEEVATICKDALGNIWFGYRDGGLYVLTNEGQLVHPRISEEVNNIINLSYSDGYIWVGTEASGLYKIKSVLKGDEVLESYHYTKEDGLSSNHIFAFIRDAQGFYWLGHENGFDRLKFDRDHKIVFKKRYGKNEGLVGLEIHENSAYIDAKDNLWFGTVNGGVYISTNNSALNTLSPQLHITKLTVLPKANLWGKVDDVEHQYLNHNLPKELELDYDHNSLNFEFVAINLSSPEATTYNWMLEGWDMDWQTSKTRRSVKYTNLPPGEYTLRIMAANENDIWSEEQRIKFTIRSPFWEKSWFIALSIVLLIGIFFVIMQLRNRKLRQDKIKLEKQINDATLELRKEKEIIEKQSKEIEIQKDTLAETNKSMTDSINYAQRIQKAIMRPSSDQNQHLKGKHTIFYRPKDIVSGDFYWTYNRDEHSLIAAADCTGHGVPGAFMSMIGISYLEQIVHDYPDILPAELLGKLRSKVIDALANDSADKTKDGMDLAMCKINWSKMTCDFAGANNPLYLIRNKELTEYKGDKMPIGEHDLKDTPFTNHTIELKEGDILYVFSDGFADQFGGERGKKYLYKRFKTLLEDLSVLPLEEQKAKLIEEFDAWKGNQEQIDDILVIGIKI